MLFLYFVFIVLRSSSLSFCKLYIMLTYIYVYFFLNALCVSIFRGANIVQPLGSCLFSCQFSLQYSLFIYLYIGGSGQFSHYVPTYAAVNSLYIVYYLYLGGPGQFSHLAPTYAAINALCIIGTEEAFQSINRQVVSSIL